MKKKITAVLMAALMLTGSVSGVYAAEPAYNQKQYQQALVNKTAVQTKVNKQTTLSYEKTSSAETRAELPFNDVAETDWYYEAVSEMYAQGLIDSNSDGKFRPEEDITGIELLTMLYRADGRKDDSPENIVSWAKSNKILLENDGWEFESDKSLKREQVMVIIYRYLLYKGVNMTNNGDLSGFSDKDKISSYAKEAVSGLASKGIISKSSGTVRPDESLTKAEAASIIAAVLKLI